VEEYNTKARGAYSIVPGKLPRYLEPLESSKTFSLLTSTPLYAVEAHYILHIFPAFQSRSPSLWKPKWLLCRFAGSCSDHCRRAFAGAEADRWAANIFQGAVNTQSRSRPCQPSAALLDDNQPGTFLPPAFTSLHHHLHNSLRLRSALNRPL
jgi:hypothetical protein